MAKKAEEIKTVGPGGTGVRPFVVPGQDPSTGTMPRSVGLPQFAGAVPMATNQPITGGFGGPTPVTGAVNADDFGLTPFLKGTDVPEEQSQIKVRVLGFVTIPGSRSPLVALIEPQFGKNYLPLNKINIQQISTITQQKDLRCIIGRDLVLTVYPVNNPSTMKMTRGLYVSGAE
jgi:hypothetical protein